MSRRLFEFERLVILSPHLDDAALSLGATVARATRSGATVVVVTVLAGDPDDAGPPGDWDRFCGFSSAGEAARVRRVEDARACAVLGAEPVWLPFEDCEQDGADRDDEAVWTALRPLLEGANAVLVPGYPHVHPDHLWLARSALLHAGDAPLGVYVEQPYAANISIGRGRSLRPFERAVRLAASTRLGRAYRPDVEALFGADSNPGLDWIATRPSRADRRLKDEAIQAYTSQVGPARLGRGLCTRIRLYETATGGEHIALLSRR